MFEVVTFVVGLLLGGFIMWCLLTTRKAGTLYFYEDEPGNPPVMCAELTQPVEDVRKCARVIFTVSHK